MTDKQTAHIVNCVNSHDDLISALHEIHSIADMHQQEHGAFQIMHIAEYALKKAGAL